MPGGALAEESPKSNANETADESQSEKKPESDEATADEVIVVTGSRQEELQSKVRFERRCWTDHRGIRGGKLGRAARALSQY